MRERPQPAEREPARDAEHQLFPDADVDHPVRVRPRRRFERLGGDVREHNGGTRILVEQRAGGTDEGVPHDHSSNLRSTRATTTCGRPGDRPGRAAASASWSRPSTVTAVQPFTVNRPAIPPGQPCVADWLSTTTTVRLSSPVAP